MCLHGDRHTASVEKKGVGDDETAARTMSAAVSQGKARKRDRNREQRGMANEAWRRRAVALLVLLGAAAAAAILCAAGIALHHRHGSTDGIQGGDDNDDDGVEAPPPATGSGCASLVRAHRCKARCGCEWCPPGPGFGCHDATSTTVPCGGRRGHRRAFWTCETHVATWLAIAGAGLVGAVFIGAAAGLWAWWPRVCRSRVPLDGGAFDIMATPINN